MRVDGAAPAAVPRAPATSIRRGEWDDATHPHERNRASYLAENFVPLADAGVVDFIDARRRGRCPASACGARAATRMHHQLVRIESGGRTAVFTADLIPTTAHLDAPWIMGYDLYPMDTLAYKKPFLREAIDREYVIFFEHDPAVAAGIIREQDGRRIVEPVDR